MTVHQRLAKSHGYYLQHAKEVRLVHRRGHGVDTVRARHSCNRMQEQRMVCAARLTLLSATAFRNLAVRAAYPAYCSIWVIKPRA